MRVIRHEWFNVSRSDVFRLVPIGDAHIGAAACDESRLVEVVNRVAADDRAYWVGLGDFAEFINVQDKRFDARVLASWIKTADLADLAGTQRDRFLDTIKPIAGKCLGLIEGNHERWIYHRFERDIHSEIVTAIKQEAGHPDDFRLGLGYYGWLQLAFYFGSDKKGGSAIINVNIHHGFVGGRLDGGKSLNMQRWLWNHDADLVLFGHSHNTMTQVAQVEGIDRAGRYYEQVRRGGYCGSFLRTVNPDGPSTYSEEKGYYPLPVAGIEVLLRPGCTQQRDRVRIIS